MRSRKRTAIFDFNHEDAYAEISTDIVLGSPRDLWGALQAESFIVVYRPTDYDPGKKWSPGFDYFCQLAHKRGNLCIVVDEAHQICRPQAIPGSFELLARTGRHREVSIVYITQSFAAVQGSLTQNTDTFFFFQIHYPWDLEGIRKRSGPEIADRVQGLRKLDIAKGIPGEILRWRDSGEVVISDQVDAFTLDVEDAKQYKEEHDALADSHLPLENSHFGEDGAGDSGEAGEPLANHDGTPEDAEKRDDPGLSGLFFWNGLR